MPLAAGRELLGAVERGGYAVPGLNVSNLEVALGAAETRRAPVLLQFNPSNSPTHSTTILPTMNGWMLQ